MNIEFLEPKVTNVKHESETLITLFNDCFQQSYQTLLISGKDEPIYLPANQQQQYHHIEFAHGYFSSALHEIAHWCIAGSERRLKIDYDYWYIPDGRNIEQQAAFEKVEIKPQALEWALSLACNFRFSVSSDNLSSIPENANWLYWSEIQQQQQQFIINIKQQLTLWIELGFSYRAQLLIDSLCKHFRQSNPITVDEIEHSELWKKLCLHD